MKKQNFDHLLPELSIQHKLFADEKERISSIKESQLKYEEKGLDYVIQTNRQNLRLEHLKSLARNEIRIIHVMSFTSEYACEIISQGAVELGYKAYTNVEKVRRIGMAYYETEHKSDLVEQYFDIARKTQEDFRQAFEPIGSPLDTLRCMLDEIWPQGAHLQTLFGKKMFVGLSRMVEPNTTFLAHHDIFRDDAPETIESESIISQFGANIYIQMPEVGGELLMWHKNMTTAEFDLKRNAEYGINIDALPCPDIVVKPKTGDLLIFDSHKLHAVSSPRDRSRLALSFFIAYRGDNQPLTFWS